MKGKLPKERKIGLVLKMAILTLIVTIIIIMVELTLFAHDDKFWNSIPPIEEEYYPVEQDARY